MHVLEKSYLICVPLSTVLLELLLACQWENICIYTYNCVFTQIYLNYNADSGN